MACFLIMTERDFTQLASSMRAGVRIMSTGYGMVGIQVNGTVAQTIGQLAANIRKSFPETEISSPFGITYLTLASIDVGVANAWLNVETGKAYHQMGYEGEEIARTIMIQKGYEIDEKTTFRGVDLPAHHSGNNFSIEVKTTMTDKSFGQLLDPNSYGGQRQCSDGWLSAVGVDPKNTTVNGILINALEDTVSFWQRVDGDAKDWRCICKDIPLSRYGVK